MSAAISNKDLVQTTQQWFKALSIKIDANYLKEKITTHQDYPAITAVADFLDAGNMQYNAVQADASFIKEFNYPLMAHIRSSEGEYMQLIKDVSDWDKQKVSTQHWSGVVFYPEKNAQWHNEEHEAAQKQTLQKNIFAAIGICIGLALFATRLIMLPLMLY